MMRKRPIAMALLLVMGSQLSAFAQTTGNPTAGEAANQFAPQPYAAEEFPQWARDLRRAEIIAFGSLPFTLFFTKMGIDTYRYADNDWDRRYAPWPLKSAGAVEMDEDLKIMALVTAAFGSVALAFVDHIIVRMKRRSAERKAQAHVPPMVITEREDWPPTVELPSDGPPDSQEAVEGSEMPAELGPEGAQ